jgi:hypothetical protein
VIEQVSGQREFSRNIGNDDSRMVNYMVPRGFVYLHRHGVYWSCRHSRQNGKSGLSNVHGEEIG